MLKNERQGTRFNKPYSTDSQAQISIAILLVFDQRTQQPLKVSCLKSPKSSLSWQLIGSHEAACYIGRLKAIREAAGDATPAAPSAAPEQPKLKFRNYNVRDQKIEHTVLEPAKAPEYIAPKPEVPAGKTAEVRLQQMLQILIDLLILPRRYLDKYLCLFLMSAQ